MTEQEDEILDSSRCKGCEHLVSRIILPLDYEEFGIDIEAIKQEIVEEEGDSGEEEDIAIVHNTCSVLNMDLNHLVLECNKFKKALTGDQNFFKSNNPWRIVDRP